VVGILSICEHSISELGREERPHSATAQLQKKPLFLRPNDSLLFLRRGRGKDSDGRPGGNSQSPAQDALLVLPFYSLLGRESSFLFLLWDAMEKVEMKGGSGRGQDLSLSPPLDFKKSLCIFLLLLNEFLPFHFLPDIRQEGGRLRPQSFFHSRLKSLPHFSVALGFEFFVSLPPKLLSRLEFVE
jgi:hypothetical protein